MSGIDVLQDFVSKDSAIKLGTDFKVGEGVFVLTEKEVKELSLSQEEYKLLKPYYTTENLQRFYGKNENTYWIIYTDSSFKKSIKMNQYPNLKKHLGKFRQILTSDNKPYGLHRARDSYFFEGEKIFSLRKCAIPTFTYSDFDCYVSRAFMSIKSTRIDNKYLIALLNSKLIAFWLKHKGKMQGFQYQVDKGPLVELPLIETNRYGVFSSLVDYILFLKANISQKTNEYVSNEHIIQSFEDVINACVYELYFSEHMKEKEIDVLCFANDLIKPIKDAKNKAAVINEVYGKLKEPSNEIRNRMMFFATRSEDIILPIQKIY